MEHSANNIFFLACGQYISFFLWFYNRLLIIILLMNGTENGTINECHVCVQFLRKRYLIAHVHNTGSKVSHLATPLIYA